MRNIVIVGNAPIEQEIGSIIDSHAVVVRAGRSQLLPQFAKHIGNRADRWVVNPANYIHVMNNQHYFKIGPLLKRISVAQVLWIEAMKYGVAEPQYSHLYKTRGDYYIEFVNQLNEYNIAVECPTNKTLTTDIANDLAEATKVLPENIGVRALAYYASTYKKQQISIAGFGPRDRFIRRPHWSEKEYELERKSRYHDEDALRELVNKWVADGYFCRLED
jgi:hypothetical protein